ncbi:NLP/P60 protein [Calothrix sp. PCC 6303]|nr:NLP/P60 protein [Calothrix sp. PCC 6303]
MMSSNIPSQIQNLTSGEYECLANLNIYDSPECNRLATQAAMGRHLTVTSNDADTAVEVCLCEDNYSGWVSHQDFSLLKLTLHPYRGTLSPKLTDTVSQAQRERAIAFTHDAMKQANYYLWGGTVAPNYDCSGLIQAAFVSVGIWLPRDAYQQEDFTESISISQLNPGDLVFFGTPQKATHVGLYLGDDRYIHSSGKEMGRNGIGIDVLSEHGDAVSRSYYQILRGAGRIIKGLEV